jgi:histidinol-phosphate aminotransferase
MDKSKYTYFMNNVVNGITGLQPYQPGKPIDELQRELGLTRITKLASNENPLGPSQKALVAVQSTIHEFCRYPDGSGFRLKGRLAGYLNQSTDRFTLGNGSNDVLELIARAFANSQHEVVFSQHAFAVYSIVTLAVGARPVVVPAKKWGHDLEAILAAINEKTAIIFLANPNNPTGTWFSKNVLENFLSQVPERIIVVLDEAYSEYIGEQDYPDGMTYLSRFPNLVVTRTFSKAWGLASLRVGYAVSNPVIADVLNRIRQPFNVNSFALAAAEAVLDDTDYLRRGIEINALGMKQIEEGLQTNQLDYIPSVGNFIAFNVGENRRAMQVNQSLLSQGVIVRPIENYDMKGFLRVSIGTKEENKHFLEALPVALKAAEEASSIE